uniref:Uncharacterized protein n=1 Tax=Fagus sylvatica TaxID=28930 RepID=A0A2N9I2E2_FAGSY
MEKSGSSSRPNALFILKFFYKVYSSLSFLKDLGVVVVNGRALDSVVGLADLGLIFCVPGDFLPISLPSLFWRGGG